MTSPFTIYKTGRYAFAYALGDGLSDTWHIGTIVVEHCVCVIGIATVSKVDNGRTESKHCVSNNQFIRCTSFWYCVFFVSASMCEAKSE